MRANVAIAKIGFWSAFVAFIGAVGYIVSVPLQILNLVSPLQDSIIAFGASLIIPTASLLTMLELCSHSITPLLQRSRYGRMQRSFLPLSIPRTAP
jgi:hypothetical protein